MSWLLLAGSIVLGGCIGLGLALRGTSLLPNGNPSIVRLATAVPAPVAAVAPSPSAIAAGPGPASSAVPAAASAASPAPGGATGEYVVQPGDTMRSIAVDVYGDASQWPRLYQANRDVVGPDPDALQAGTRLRVPPLPASTPSPSPSG